MINCNWHSRLLRGTRRGALATSFICTLSAVAFAGESISADINLIVRLGPRAYQNEKFRSPFVALFQRGKKVLIFVAGDHGTGINSPAAKTIRQAFKTNKPQAVIVEGLSSSGKNDADDRLRQAKAFAAEWPDEFPENYYPIYLADQTGIPYVGGEPGLNIKLDALKPLGYEAEDLLGLSIGANIGALSDDCSKSRDMCAKMHNEMAARTARELGIPGAYGYDDFEQWYSRRVGPQKPPHQLTAEDCKPVGGPKATYLQTMAFHLELIRETSIVRQVERMLNAHDRVLIVYGSGHLVRQREVWKNALGPSKDLKPF